METQFSIGLKTAARDLSELVHWGFVEYAGHGLRGYYQLLVNHYHVDGSVSAAHL